MQKVRNQDFDHAIDQEKSKILIFFFYKFPPLDLFLIFLVGKLLGSKQNWLFRSKLMHDTKILFFYIP